MQPELKEDSIDVLQTLNMTGYPLEVQGVEDLAVKNLP